MHFVIQSSFNQSSSGTVWSETSKRCASKRDSKGVQKIEHQFNACSGKIQKHFYYKLLSSLNSNDIKKFKKRWITSIKLQSQFKRFSARSRKFQNVPSIKVTVPNNLNAFFRATKCHLKMTFFSPLQYFFRSKRNRVHIPRARKTERQGSNTTRPALFDATWSVWTTVWHLR